MNSNGFWIKYYVISLLVLTVTLTSACSPDTAATPATTVPVQTQSPTLSTTTASYVSPSAAAYTYQIINVYPHDREAFTEGLVWDNGSLYESTGLNGKSWLREVDLATGSVKRNYSLPEEYFGEGITVFKDEIIQLTWKSKIGFVYNKADFKKLRDFTYSTEGWGITQDGSRLIMSDGTSRLYFLNPDSYQVIGSITVSDGNIPVENLNELEYINGQIYANVWKTEKIAIIDPGSGHVTGWIVASGLLRTQSFIGQVDVLNGIAYDSQTDKLLVTGKYWPYLFEIKPVLLPVPRT